MSSILKARQPSLSKQHQWSENAPEMQAKFFEHRCFQPYDFIVHLLRDLLVIRSHSEHLHFVELMHTIQVAFAFAAWQLRTIATTACRQPTVNKRL